MANTREIQSRMKSIEDTRKITNAMYMISSTKLKKARKNLEETESYFYTHQAMIERILRHLPEIESRFLDGGEEIPPEKRRRGLVVMTADKGLAGAYNHNVLKKAHEWLEQPGENRLYVVGELGRQYFAGKGVPVEEHFNYTAQNPTMHRARMISWRVVEAFREGELDEIWTVYTRMVNGMQEEAEIARLLPLSRKKFTIGNTEVAAAGEFTMLPTPREALDALAPNYVTGFFYGALVESFCSEQNARMLAMEAANNSASDMLKELSIVYNRLRQAAITQEITEVISGAKAQKKKKSKRNAV